MSLTEVPPEQLTAILARAEALKQQRLDEDKAETILSTFPSSYKFALRAVRSFHSF